jgi:RimJ/RimL family protein N-acetyltransferase
MPLNGVEIGWRLSTATWGHGYATEAARAVLAYGFDKLDLPEIVAIAAARNVRSHAVMRRLGMTHDPADDFEDVSEPPGPLRSLVVYRLRRPA